MKTYTISNRKDGFGSQYKSMMYCLAYCHYIKDAEYIHTPFQNIGHKQSAKEFNEFIGFPIPKFIPKNIDFPMKLIPRNHRTRNPDKYFTKKIRKLIRFYYYSTNKPIINNIDIAIHIRRGDVNSENINTKNRYTPNDYYIKIIKYLKNIYPNYNITIFSEGNINDFYDLQNLNISFKLNYDLKKTFHSLVRAKVLVTSVSSLSFCAAVLNKNIIYVISNKQDRLKYWNMIDL